MPKPSFLLTPLPDLARRLLSEGPVKILSATPRRIRVLFGGTYIADTTSALRVWEHPYYPAYYLPLSSFREGVLQYKHDDDGDRKKKGEEVVVEEGAGFAQAVLKSNGKETDRVIVFLPRKTRGKGEEDGEQEEGKTIHAAAVPSNEVVMSPGGKVLAGLVRIEFGAMDAWLEEDERIYVHPKDPYKRVDIVHSSRRVVVSLEGVKVADTATTTGGGGGGGGCWHLYETGLPVRFYLPITAVLDWRMLKDSSKGTRTECPYKGVAEYYDLVLPSGKDGSGEDEGEKGLKDIVWYYRNPTVECAAITGALCFYNEKVDIELDGKKLERPKTPFS